MGGSIRSRRGEWSERRPYAPPTLLVDLYELTMAESYVREALADLPATFQLLCRHPPMASSRLSGMLSGTAEELSDGARSTRTPSDVIVIGGHWPGDPRRTSRILTVLGRAGKERYRVRWDDGHTAIYYPNSDVVIQHVNNQKAGRFSPAAR